MANLYVLAGAAAVAAGGHALIPDHWLPFVLTARALGMSRGQALVMAGTGAVAHLFSTTLIGLVFMLAGSNVALRTARGLDTSIGLVVVGLGFYFLGRGWLRGVRRGHEEAEDALYRPHRSGAAYTLGAILGIRPCAEALPIFLAASTQGLFSSLAAIVAWVSVTVVSMIGIVWLSVRGLENVRFAWLENYGEAILGFIIVVAGIVVLL